MQNYNLRWRVVAGKIPLLNRHYRALEPLNLPEPLTAWIHERLEWAADNSLYKGKDAIICLAIDPTKDVVVSLEDLRPKPELSPADIVAKNQQVIGVTYQDQPLQGTVWLEQESKLIAALQPNTQQLTTATDTLALQLAETLGIATQVESVSISQISAADAVFVVSDEFGFIPIKTGGSAAAKLSDCFVKMFEPE